MNLNDIIEHNEQMKEAILKEIDTLCRTDKNSIDEELILQEKLTGLLITLRNENQFNKAMKLLYF